MKLIAAILAASFLFPLQLRAQERSDMKGIPSIVVVGRGEVYSKPDRATVNLGATFQAKDAAAAQAKVNSVVSQAIDKIKALGIPESAIQTSGLSIYPVHAAPRSPDDQEPRIAGYQASNTVLVRVDDLAKIGAVIDAGVGAGVNQMQGVSFSIKDDLPQRQDALKKAAVQALTKAQAIAEAMGVSLGGVMEVMEGDVGGGPRPMMEMARMSDSGGAPIQPGELQVESSLTVRFRIAEPK